MPEFKIEKQSGSRDGVRILKLTGPFTLAGIFDFQAIVRDDPPPTTIVDLADVPYMDSAALGSLLGLHVSCQRHGRNYMLIGVSPRIETLFQVAGVNGILAVSPSLAEAENLLVNAEREG